MSRDERLRIAVFIDFDNIEIGVKNTLNASFDAGLVLEALKERGEVVSKTAYSDWQRAGGYSRMLTQHAIRMVQRNLTPGGDKNGADINLALDALEMAFTHAHINAFVIVGGDSDFISLVEKLKQYDKKVFVVGGRAFTSQILQKNCHEFIAYENLTGATNGPSPARRTGGREPRGDRTAIEQAIPLVTRALKVLSEREVSPQLGLLKSTLLQLDSTFSERTYGASSFRDFAQKLERAGVLHVHQAKGGWIVGPVEGATNGDGAAPADDSPIPPAATPAAAPRSSAAPAVQGSTSDGLRELQRILATGEIRRWPLYLRNVKQVIRQVNATFDERAYGFANLVDLLRAAHKEGIVRVDRDRQGVVRVFQSGSAAAPKPVTAAADIVEVDAADAVDIVPVNESVDDATGAGVPAAIMTAEVSSADEMAAIDAAVDGNVQPAAAPRRRRSRGNPSAAPRPRSRKKTLA